MDAEDKQFIKKPTKVEEMSKEQIREAIQKKRECNAKAQVIVESLLEKGISDTYLLQCLPDINQSHFEDIIEERAILHECGYPLCSNDLLEKDIPKQKYRISLRTNKVYDITARKNFCSNSCYKAAMFVQKQMLTSPLWFREYEKIPTFNLLVEDHVGSLGHEIDVALIEKVNIKPKMFSSIYDFANANLNELAGNENDPEGTAEKGLETYQLQENSIGKCENKESTDTTEHLTPQSNKNCNTNLQDTRSLSNKSSISCKKDILKKKPTPNPMNIVGDVIEKKGRVVDPILTKTPNTEQLLSDSPAIKCSENIVLSAKKIVSKKQPAITTITIEVEKCLAEWFTLDTLIFLFGESKVKEMVADKGECIKEYMDNYAKSIFYTSNTYDQYQALCRKLNMLELEDRKHDSETFKRETKPLPNYSVLQKESKKMELKVNYFLAGKTNLPDLCVEENPTTDDDENVQLPLVDKNAQNALRRKIVCEHLNKVLPDLLRSLGLLTLSISSDVRLIVNTFKLKANNIMFKPIQWTLIAIIIIKLLSLRDRRLEYLLEQQMGYEHMQLLLLSYKQDGGYLERLISWLTDVDRLLDTNDTQLTVE
ncbi:putative RNA polymerase II subunit B1 CTD phosphatase RPAP2 [Hyposmocoma kahamanoa]|uniref:putative RNA polymerase II subunit B1 CTD phosphatase RPAP2 n=1 Tax=Hyposmocoma kahamanoa TaxID=1477025 RepID=UPI000E6D9FE4|nr:putative RNA polymerase II subunit B1 CTD phosphatase RPAP2 [Hyposmocoma kahamanoa]